MAMFPRRNFLPTESLSASLFIDCDSTFKHSCFASMKQSFPQEATVYRDSIACSPQKAGFQAMLGHDSLGRFSAMSDWTRVQV